jgi:hypothetical protein
MHQFSVKKTKIKVFYVFIQLVANGRQSVQFLILIYEQKKKVLSVEINYLSLLPQVIR